MPRKRPPPLQAAASLSARLPLGTPVFLRDTGQPQAEAATPTSNNTTRTKPTPASHDLSDSDTTTTTRTDSGASSRSGLVMASTVADQPQSIAAAKLERQNKRIEATNAALTAPALPEKHKQTTRTRGKAWKPFDFATEANDLPPVESRVNVFRVPSQGSSLSRSVSRISSRTQDSSYTESERHDSSSFLESDDFQVFTGRKKGRPAVSAFHEKLVQNTATVEATFCKRDITDVFGNELPGPGFMDGNPGSMDGQLQFIQHPNGDVSAHQWSASRFGWENIGQYSNIRKKIEGQLAADRLKGETAWQSLQQNTLAYFRTVAKQREANAIGRPFGAKEIAALLPDTRPPSTAPTGPRRVTSKVEMPERPSTMMPRQDSQPSQISVGSRESTAAMPPKPNFESMPRAQVPPPQLDQRLNPARNFTPTARENVKEDPFTTNYSLQNTQAYTTKSSITDQQMSTWSAYQPWSNFMPFYYNNPYALPGMNYAGSGYIPHAPRPLYDYSMNDLSDHIARTHLGLPAQHVQQSQAPLPPPEQSPKARETSDRTTVSGASPSHQAEQSTGAQRHSTSSASSKHASPTRIAMREHVMKMGEQAKERTKSQANIGRTVLYDPFQDQQQKEPEPVKQEAVKRKVPPAAASLHNTLGHFPTLGLGMIPGLGDLSGHGQDPFPTTLAPSVKMPFNATAAPSENDLRDSSPDREWQRSTAAASEQHGNHNSSLKPWDADQLDEWLWSGNKFARQEDFHQRIMATDATPIRRKSSSTTTIRPIAPPAFSKLPKKQPTTPYPDSNILTNRLLVPVLENLASYVQGPIEKRRDYFCQWTKAPEWAIDRSASGNDSFFDSEWGQPPARLGRDPRYQPVPRGMDVRFGSYDAPRGGQTVAMPPNAGVGTERRFGFGGRF